MAAVAALTLADICLDVQIDICMFLHPFDILELRKTCKAFQRSTRQRVVWVAALHRVCLDNTLFLPSFPISDMSDLEIEKAAMGPRRWIELCGAYEKQHLNDPDAILCPRATRIINDSLAIDFDYESARLFMVPGGRYLVNHSPGSNGISVLDLGYTSCADCKIIASVGLEGAYDIWSQFSVQATPDGMGLTIFSSNSKSCSVYEIYPQSEKPHLTQIAHLDFDPSGDPPAYLLPGTVIWFHRYVDRAVFRVWDYGLNHSISFSVDITVGVFETDVKVMATKTTVIFLRKEAILIWAIPSLSPQPPDFFDHNPTHIPPIFTIPFPDGIELNSELIQWSTISPWYFGSSQPLYFDTLCQGSKLHRFQIMLKPDLSTASLHVIHISELTPHDFNYVMFQDYTICEDALVSCWFYSYYNGWDQYQYGLYTGLTSARFANIISQGGPAAKMLLPDIGRMYYLFWCTASGRLLLSMKTKEHRDGTIFTVATSSQCLYAAVKKRDPGYIRKAPPDLDGAMTTTCASFPKIDEDCETQKMLPLRIRRTLGLMTLAAYKQNNSEVNHVPATCTEVNIPEESGWSKRRRVLRQLALPVNGCPGLDWSSTTGLLHLRTPSNELGCEIQWYDSTMRGLHAL